MLYPVVYTSHKANMQRIALLVLVPIRLHRRCIFRPTHQDNARQYNNHSSHLIALTLIPQCIHEVCLDQLGRHLDKEISCRKTIERPYYVAGSSQAISGGNSLR